MILQPLFHRQKALLVWIGVAIVLGGLQVVAEASYSKQDDPDQAKQRPGFVVSKSELAPRVPGIRYGIRPTIIIFDRMAMDSSLFHDLADQSLIASRANLELVTQMGMKPTISDGIDQAFADPDSKLAHLFHFDTPTDKGYPIGYVIIDPQGYIRYRTLDPDYMHHGDELLIMLKDSNK